MAQGLEQADAANVEATSRLGDMRETQWQLQAQVASLKQQLVNTRPETKDEVNARHMEEHIAAVHSDAVDRIATTTEACTPTSNLCRLRVASGDLL